MTIFTHLFIAKELKNMIYKEFNIKVNTKAFLYGSIKPDLLPFVIRAPHKITLSKNFLLNEVRKLSEADIKGEKCSWNFSVKLGVITHYLADFFCYVHSDRFSGSLLQHFAYEFKPLRYSLKEIREAVGSIKPIHSINIHMNFLKLIEHLDEVQHEYSQKPPTRDEDMFFTLKMCAAFCYSILVVAADLVKELEGQEAGLLMLETT